MTKLIVELGGDVHFETTFGRGASKYSAIKIASELKKMEFPKDKKITAKVIDTLLQILKRQVMYQYSV